MPAERVAMRQVREIIRLKFSAGISTREIARRLGIAASTVRETGPTGRRRSRAKLKAALRKAAARSIEALVHAIAAALAAFTAQECLNFFAAAGYDSA